MNRSAPQPYRLPQQTLRWGTIKPRLGLSFLATLLTIALQSGCRGIGKPDQQYDLLTAELRTREQELLQARSELAQLRLLTETYQRQLGAGNNPAVPTWPGCLTSDPPAFHSGVSTPALPVRDIHLAAGTGGYDRDDLPGDEALQVVVVPRDVDGSPVKAPGRLAVTAYEVSPEGLKTLIGRWEVSAEQLRKSWRNGLFASGYYVVLQWDQAPRMKRLRIVARFVTLDGREYEADRDTSVRPLPGIGASELPIPEVEEAIPRPTQPLPMLPPATPQELPPPATLESPAARLGGIRKGSP
jgi:hypothetical protein